MELDDIVLKEVERRDDLFVKATGSYDKPGLYGPKRRVRKAGQGSIGYFYSHLGTLAYVDPQGDVYVGTATKEAMQVLIEAGYRQGWMWVPHSNDNGEWMQEHFDKTIAMRKQNPAG
jgi:hypothetical protein